MPPSPTVRKIVRWLPLAFGVVALSTTKNQDLQDRPFGKPLSRDNPESVHTARALEPGRGRTAKVPWHIPWCGWRDILWRTYRQIGEDRLLAVAAGVVFFGLLALFPAVTALVSFYGLFADSSTIADNLDAMAIVMPSDAIDIVTDQVGRVLAKGEAKLSLSFAFGLAFALWSANAGVKAVIDALNVVYEETEKRGLIRFNLISLAFTLGAILVALLSLAFVVFFPLLLARVGLGPLAEAIIGVLRWPALLILIIFGLAIIYRYGPSRRTAQWQWISIGSLLACVLWMLGSAVFSWYLAKFADYDAAYGTLGAVIGMMMWMWLSVIVILAGAELNSEIEHQTAEDSTVGLDKPLGARGATMADTVGDAQ